MKNKERETRERETRAAELRHTPCEFEEYSVLAAPLGTKRDGYSQKWVNVSIHGVNTRSIERHRKMGWEFIPKDRCLNYSAIDSMMTTNVLSSHYITNADTVLMEIPNEKLKRIDAERNKAAEDKVRGVSGVISARDQMAVF